MLQTQRHCMLYGQIKGRSENMTQTQLENMVLDLQRQVKELASRPYTQRSEEAKGEALNAQAGVKCVNNEVLESAITMTDFLEEYYMSQYGL